MKWLFHHHTHVLASVAILATALGTQPALATDSAATDSASSKSVDCPVRYGKFAQAVKTVTPTVVVEGALGLPMWAVVVNRDGVVCAVPFSGQERDDQWLLSRQIAAAKAFTANGLSTSPAQTFTTAQLYDLVQPNTGPLFGVEAGNPVDTKAAYKGPQRRWGTANDPMVGEIVGGTITFGGGSPLIAGGQVVGGIGVSGDIPDRDQAVADALKAALHL